MYEKNDLTLSLGSGAFDQMREDFDQVLTATLSSMRETGQDSAEIGIKVKISLTESSAPDYSVAGSQQTRDVTKPEFAHTITATIQRRLKKTGTFEGEYELVWDQDTGSYVARPIDYGQASVFDNGYSADDFVVLDPPSLPPVEDEEDEEDWDDDLEEDMDYDEPEDEEIGA